MEDFTVDQAFRDVIVSILSTCFGKAHGKKYTHVGKLEMLECLTKMNISSELSQAWPAILFRVKTSKSSIICFSMYYTKNKR